MLPSRVEFPSTREGGRLAPLKGTVVDISPGGVCMRVAMDDEALAVMRQVEEGLYLELEVSASELRTFKVLGRVAWIWVPTMEGDDRVGSLGVDIKGVAEQDGTVLGRLRRLFARDDEVDVDRSSRIIRTRAGRAPASPSPPPTEVRPEEAAEPRPEGRDE